MWLQKFTKNQHNWNYECQFFSKSIVLIICQKNKLEKAKSTVYIWTSFDSLHMVPNNLNKTCILLVNETDFNNLKKKYQLVDRIGVRVTQVCFFCNRNNSEDKLIFYKDHQGKPVFWELYRFIPLSYYFLSSFEYNSVFIVHLRWC